MYSIISEVKERMVKTEHGLEDSGVGGHSRDHRNLNYTTMDSNGDRLRRPTLGWRLLKNRIWSVDGLEEVKRDGVYSRTHLQGEEFPRPSQDLEGTMIQLRESGWKHPCEQIQSLQRSEQQELELQQCMDVCNRIKDNVHNVQKFNNLKKILFSQNTAQNKTCFYI